MSLRSSQFVSATTPELHKYYFKFMQVMLLAEIDLHDLIGQQLMSIITSVRSS